jgi:hypothetical protein
MLRKPLLLIAVSVLALVAPGCMPFIQNESSTQQDLIGPVAVSSEMCEVPVFASLPFRSAAARKALVRKATTRGPGIPLGDLTCPTEQQVIDGWGDLPLAGGLGIRHQALVSFRVPAGATAPESFTTTVKMLEAPEFTVSRRITPDPAPAPVTRTVTFRRAPQLDTKGAGFLDLVVSSAPPEIQSAVGKLVGDGQKLVGYQSDPINGVTLGDFKVSATFGLPGGSADQPAGGTFNALSLAGSRLVLSDEEWASIGAVRAARAAGRDLKCLDADALEELMDNGPSAEIDLLALAWCPLPSLAAFADADSAEEALAAYAKLYRGIDLKVRDARVLGSDGFAEQGGTATVPFTLRTTGDASDTLLALTAATTLPGATATPAAASTAFPAAGDTGKPVTVTVPANAVPGTYDVTLTAKVGGQARTGTGHVVVLPKAPPAATPNKSRDNLYMDAAGNIAFGWVCPPACGSDTVDVTAPKAGIAPAANTAAAAKPRLLRIARGKFNAQSGKRARVKVKLFPKAQRAIRRGRAVTAIVVVRDASGKPEVRRVVIRRKKK